MEPAHFKVGIDVSLCLPVRVYHQIAMLGGRSNEPRTNEQWVAQYAGSHQHPVNRICHTLGIPAILLSVLFVPRSHLYSSIVDLCACAFRCGMDVPVHRPRFRRQRA